jgi:hypothetical protein
MTVTSDGHPSFRPSTRVVGVFKLTLSLLTSFNGRRNPMLELDSTPPTDPNGQPLPIRRTPAKGFILGIVTAKSLLGTFTHYYGGRTVPCTHDDCEPCRDGTPYRWHAYLSAYDVAKKLHFLFECTAAAADAFVKYASEHETLRGCCFNARRSSTRMNARVEIETHMYTGNDRDLPPPADVVSALARLWNIPLTQILTPAARETQRNLKILANRQNSFAPATDPSGNGDQP